MKVKELIEVLSKEDPEKDVFVSYDSMCCQYHAENIIEVYEGNKFTATGIHILAEYRDGTLWKLGIPEESDGDVINRYPVNGRIVNLGEE